MAKPVETGEKLIATNPNAQPQMQVTPDAANTPQGTPIVEAQPATPITVTPADDGTQAPDSEH